MNDYDKNEILSNLSLGQETKYHSTYKPELLEAVPRALNRQELGVVEEQPFKGCDVWHAYEMSWLNTKGKPVVALGRFSVPFDTPNIIESKSFKLYLNSFNQSRFDSHKDITRVLNKDLSSITGGKVSIELFAPDDESAFPVTQLPGACIDSLDINIDDFNLNPSLLTLDSAQASSGKSRTEETIHSHLLKSNCLITNQPDWASVIISYRGIKIDHSALLRYLISFRQHNEFHEQCVERIFMDITNACAPESLTVQALYTRRGGLDINPFRSSKTIEQAPILRINRQ